MCERCAELEERVAWLESELGLQADLTRTERLRRVLLQVWFAGRTDSGRGGGVRLALALYDAKGRAMSRDQLLEAVPPARGGEDERLPKIVDVWVCWARKGLGRDAIVNVWGKGYQLSPAGLQRITEIIGDGQPKMAA